MAADPKRSLGRRFSHVYLNDGDLLQDSKRARRRVASLIGSQKDFIGLWDYLIAELGVDVCWGSAAINWPGTLDAFESSDFFDAITLAYKFLMQRGPLWVADAPNLFLAECRRIFSEERLSYEIDNAGGVHFKVDAEFAAGNDAAIAALGLPRYANARAQFEQAMAALSITPIDGKSAIRGVFNAAECIFRLMNSRSPKLTATDAIKALQQSFQPLLADNPLALRAASKSVNSFADWVDACHNYRHEEGAEDPSQPPVDLTVLLVSQGASFIRWLIKIDQQTKQQ